MRRCVCCHAGIGPAWQLLRHSARRQPGRVGIRDRFPLDARGVQVTLVGILELSEFRSLAMDPQAVVQLERLAGLKRAPGRPGSRHTLRRSTA